MNGWVDRLHALASAGQHSVLVTLINTRGSSPRASGAKMIVTAEDCFASIGGGQLEHRCIGRAREMLAPGSTPALEKFKLGTPLDQCCGGAVEVLFEPLDGSAPDWLQVLKDEAASRAVLATSLPEHPPYKRVFVPGDDLAREPLPSPVANAIEQLLKDGGTRLADGILLEALGTTDLNIAVFGAGHVGRALVGILAGLDANIRWIDDRDGMLTDVPEGVAAVNSASPASEVAAMPPGSFYLVMTHSHALDLGICAAVLERGDAAYCGLIGSATKRRRFENHFSELGLGQDRIDTLTCPIGIGGIGGKQPAVIAIAVAAEILQVYERLRASPGGVR